MTDKQLQDNRVRIGKRLAELRAAKGMHQVQVAEVAGIQQANLSRIEKGKYSAGIDVLSRIAAALDCEIDIRDKSGLKN